MTSKHQSEGDLGEENLAEEGAGNEDPVGLIQYIQLVPDAPDKKVSRWARLAGFLSRVVRSRFGLRSVELVDRFAQARVAEVEGEAKIKHAKAVAILASAAHEFAQAKAVAAGARSQPSGAESGSAGIESGHDRVDSAVAELKAALAILEEKGAYVHVHLADGNPSLPKLPG